MDRRPLSDAIETILGHRFTRPELLREALTHRSALQGSGRARGSNERLEFIGDRVLGLLMAEWLAERFPARAGRRARAAAGLSGVAAGAGRGRRGDRPGRRRCRWRRAKRAPACKRRATVLADALEAALGALYLDGGLEAARGVRAPRLGCGDDRPGGAAEGRQDRVAGMGAAAHARSAGVSRDCRAPARRTRRCSSSRCRSAACRAPAPPAASAPPSNSPPRTCCKRWPKGQASGQSRARFRRQRRVGARPGPPRRPRRRHDGGRHSRRH